MAKNYSNVNSKNRSAEEDAYSSYADEQSKNRNTNKSTNKSYSKSTNKSGTNKVSDDMKDCGKNKNAYDSTDRY